MDSKAAGTRTFHAAYFGHSALLAFPAEVHYTRQRLGLNWCLSWSLLLYFAASSVFLSVTLYSRICRPSVLSDPPTVSPQPSSRLDSLPMDHLLSKATLIYPPPQSFDPFVLKAAIDPAAVTACLWSTDHEIDIISTWAVRWSGPISLVMTTSVVPSSPEHEILLKRLIALTTRRPLLNSTLTVHLLHLDTKSPENPNAFLNLARLLSPTPRIVLFPGNFSTAPPKNLYRTLAAHTPASDHSAAMREPPNAPRPRPTVLTTGSQTGFPFSPLAPVVLGRDDALWCTERFFPPLSRAADWEECLWQIWLENFGDVEVRQTRGWLHEAQPAALARQPDSTAVAKFRRRLVAKYRSETCVLATRQLAALRSADKALDVKKARWLKRVCRGWTSAAQL